MEKIDQLRQYGLFDARVPRYTSYPPAHNFQYDAGHKNQAQWLQALPENAGVSVYIHVPFCKRLCWFCACRTQGTKTTAPVDSYVESLKQELSKVADTVSGKLKMTRLHLGGGTPTLLTPKMLSSLLNSVHAVFDTQPSFEFSVEIDPTAVSDSVLDTLVEFGLSRASIGIQDFAPQVQEAIGRSQSLIQTQQVIASLRNRGVKNVHLDLLYGLPRQTSDSFAQTLENATAMGADRLAIYGYAHVPWMSKRQVMIKKDDLPLRDQRFAWASMARHSLVAGGYEPIGIDHFALPFTGLSVANRQGTLRRGLQGYTDDPAETLIGLGASAISRFAQGYVQNTTATSSYQKQIKAWGLAGQKGHVLTQRDGLAARIIEDLMCRFSLRMDPLLAAFPDQSDIIEATQKALLTQYPDIFTVRGGDLDLKPYAQPLVRMVAHHVDMSIQGARA